VLPAIREFSVKIAQGQSAVGTWGHGMAWPDANNGAVNGRLGGYGALNQAGIICHLSMALAKKCGVQDEAVDRAIDKANTFFGFYAGKGAIPYGDHNPAWHVHDDNGKNSIAAVLFDVQELRPEARFFSRMTVASYPERERGHTGNYFSFLWGPLGANRAGVEAVAAFLKEQTWFYDLGRKWDGSFPYQGGAGMSGAEHQYGNWDCTGAYMLTYALPLKKLYMTGKGVSSDKALTGASLKETIAAGHGFNSWDMGAPFYRAKSVEELFKDLQSWSPAVRQRAAKALAEKPDNFVPRYLDMLDGKNILARYGACQGLGALKSRAEPAVTALTTTIWDRDLWLRIQASYALSEIGAPSRPSVPELLKLAIRNDEEDPRQMTQRYLAFALFYPGGALGMKGLLADSIEGLDRQLLYTATERLLRNPDGRARTAVASLYKHLTYEELKPLLPIIHETIVTPAPTGVMFASGIRLRGLELLAKHRVREGIPLCIEVMEIDAWGKRNRIDECLKILRSYGGSAKEVLPQLRALEQQLLKHHEVKGLAPQIDNVRKTIAHIETSRELPDLRSLDLAQASASNP